MGTKGFAIISYFWEHYGGKPIFDELMLQFIIETIIEWKNGNGKRCTSPVTEFIVLFCGKPFSET